MATRPYKSVAEKAKDAWTPETHEIAAQLATDLQAEVSAQVALGRDLTSARTAASLTQTELAARASVQQAEISRIERGLGNPTRDTLVRLAGALGFRLALVPTEDKPKPA